jgi:hypothetical protein
VPTKSKPVRERVVDTGSPPYQFAPTEKGFTRTD